MEKFPADLGAIEQAVMFKEVERSGRATKGGH
jgi:hypothetical protein